MPEAPKSLSGGAEPLVPGIGWRKLASIRLGFEEILVEVPLLFQVL